MGTILTRTGLTRPAAGETDWHTPVNAWWDKLDTYGGFTDLTATWSAVQTFASVVINAGTAALSTLTFQKDSNTLASAGVVHAATGSATATSTNDLNSKTLAATLTAGRVFRVTSGGTYAWGSGTVKYDVLLGGTTVAETPAITPPGSAGNWRSVVDIYVTNTSAARGIMHLTIDDGTSAPAVSYCKALAVAPTLTGTPILKTRVTISASTTWVELVNVMEMLN